MRHATVLLPLVLAACVSSQDEPYVCDCLETPTDEQSMAMMGFTDAALYGYGSKKLDDGTEENWYQYNPQIATPEMIAASPAATCGYWGQAVVSSRITENFRNEDTLKQPGSRYLIVTCAAKDEGASS